MLTEFSDVTIRCPKCGNTEMFVHRIGHVTETKKKNKKDNEKNTVLELHNDRIALICSKCSTIVKEYDSNKTLVLGE